MLKRKRLGREIRLEESKEILDQFIATEYNLNLFELLKSYSSIIMTKIFKE